MNTSEISRPIWVRPREAARLSGIGLTRFYDLIRTGEVISVKRGRMRLVSVASIEQLAERIGKSAA